MQHGPKCRKCRREKQKLFLKGEKCLSSKCPVVQRNYPPGRAGPTRSPHSSKISDYGKQLRSKQQVKRIYGLKEKNLKNYYQQASSVPGDTSTNLLRLLETRLDSVVFNSGLFPSRATARQVVTHGHFLLNGRRVDIPSILVKSGDKLELRAKSKKSKLYTDIQKADPSVSWVKFDHKSMTGTVTAIPSEDDLANLSLPISAIIEIYSR